MPGTKDELDDFDSFNDLNPRDNDDDGQTVKLPQPREPANEDDTIDVEIIDDTPERDRKARPLDRPVDDPTDEELQNYGDRARKRIGELTHARHDERRRAEQLQRERDAAIETAQRLLARAQEYENTIKSGSEQFVKATTEAAEAAVNAAKAKLKKAKDDYDTEAEVEALAELNSAQLRLENAKNFKLPSSQSVADEVKTPSNTTSTPRLDPKTEAWVSRNPWFNDPDHADVASYALGLHKKLVDSGVDPRSDKYFEEIDSKLEKLFPDVVGSQRSERRPREDDPPQRRTPSPVAPANRSTAPKKITLTASQVAIARTLGLTPQQYAAQLIKEAKNG